MASQPSTLAPASALEIVSVRVFAAPREKVFGAFADPTQVAQWWGPDGFTNKIHEFDLRPGGTWRLTMVAPDGAEFHNLSRFLAVEAPARVVFQHEEPVHRFQMTMTFAAEGAGTQLTWRMRFAAPDEFARVRDFIAAANEQNFDRLAALLAKTL